MSPMGVRSWLQGDYRVNPVIQLDTSCRNWLYKLLYSSKYPYTICGGRGVQHDDIDMRGEGVNEGGGGPYKQNMSKLPADYYTFSKIVCHR
ncbi:hypothetical protein GDO81_009051 [Engystomops pustulosus]|uniref:Uncharacterized protein n=1 Tax=Engystomops pustulosus TaxID=76066 RepID=A0AAV7BNL4_ENGPU|nr:hypothetical protein GDO81_009051 [Engystomops pustulosus]